MIAYNFQKPQFLTDDQIIALYASVGWTAYTQRPENTLAALANSTVLWATSAQQLVGLARGVTDGHTILYVQDILVAPDYQRHQLGSQLVHRLLDHYQNVGQTVLITDPDAATAAFYRSLDFHDVTPQDYGRAFVLDRRYH